MKLVNKLHQLKFTRRIYVVIALCSVVVLIGLVSWLIPKNEDHAHHHEDSAFNQQTSRHLVDMADSAPQTGRDPSQQQQASLNDAASRPTASGKQTDKPAADVQGDHNHDHATHEDVVNDPSETGVGLNGCYVDYGVQGEQCVPAHIAGDDKKLSCHEVHSKFANGIKVTGTDRFGLDKNHDGVACGDGDGH